MSSPLIRWVERPRAGHGVYVASDGDDWSFHGYDELAGAARAAAADLLTAGLRPGEIACLILPSGPEFVAALIGSWVAGATACPIVPPLLFQDEDEYARHVAGILRAASPAVVVTDEALGPVVARAMADAELGGSPLLLGPPGRGAAGAAEQADVALLQFTSGSTGQPRGVQVSFANLDANIAMIRRWLEMGPEDGTASWLPLYHDMGLIGCLLTVIANQSDVWLMRPEQFVRTPERWLSCFGRDRACITAAPSFGYGYAARRVRPECLEGMDFSRWRAAIVGAEPIDPVALDSFASLLEPHGFSRRTFLPAYGLAEATLAVTGLPLRESPEVVRIDWRRLRFGETVGVEQRVPLGTAPLDPGAGWLIGCGPPQADLTVSVRDGEGRLLPPGHFGEITVRGPSVTRGYRHGHAASHTRFVDGELRSGDAGFVAGGQLFVVGRIGDSLQVRGRSVYVEDLESKLAGAAGLGKGRCAVVSIPEPGRSGVVALVEAEPGSWVEGAAQLLRQELGDGVRIRVLAGRKGLIRRTSSGKPRRHHMWEQLQSDRLPGSVVFEEG